jgi:hypothetical protein
MRDSVSRCGVDEPEAEITILIEYCRFGIGDGQCRSSEIETQAQAALTQAADRLERFASAASQADSSAAPPRPKKKLFIGIGRILAGAVTGAGNLLLASGAVVAPSPAIAYGVIGSAALAIGSISQGIGDIRGE